MKTQFIPKLITNHFITTRIIELHEKGYHLDFRQLSPGIVQCVQNNLDFETHELSINVIDQVFDQFSKSFKYIHSVETTSGYKGVLLCDTLFTTPIRKFDTLNLQKMLFL